LKVYTYKYIHISYVTILNHVQYSYQYDQKE